MNLPIIDNCDDCGLCCMHMATPPFMRDELDQLPIDLQQEIYLWIDSPRRTLADHQPCIWLDVTAGKCKHHNLRPNICRDFEIGSDACRSYRQEVQI